MDELSFFVSPLQAASVALLRSAAENFAQDIAKLSRRLSLDK